MSLSPRMQQIKQYLAEHGEVQIDVLANIFEVTTQTIRRDVNLLCEQGIARRVHGGVSLPPSLSNTSFENRIDVACTVKQSIAQAIVQQIPEGATVMLGIGTSMDYVARQLVLFKSLRVVTNNLQVARTLEASDGIEVYLSGGLIRSNYQDLVGQSTLRFFSEFEADIGIIGCGSVSSSQTAMEHEPQEAEISKAILANARESWLFADESKWQLNGSVKVASLNSFSRIFTNNADVPCDLPVQQVTTNR
ncbi:DeoR/GlpR family DNA-binding transcription regulator [Reinekea marina]|uniref:DeoR/GlpR family DNA-binding transcription regulator n=1 Tax=Reinekea marina TaxID=1310421 RepID=A0ABV7WVS1_9GAMM|nr:DeoR/GlpR family DNA-binding transcription regulator [Reinekea marina]MDN3649669.1 DeoR/GlpR family DNA-binding transcription regulator [Reinekea marina]